MSTSRRILTSISALVVAGSLAVGAASSAQAAPKRFVYKPAYGGAVACSMYYSPYGEVYYTSVGRGDGTYISKCAVRVG